MGGEENARVQGPCKSRWKNSPAKSRFLHILKQTLLDQYNLSERSKCFFELSLQRYYITRVHRLKHRLIAEQDCIAANATRDIHRVLAAESESFPLVNLPRV